jgi:hypothetical protein
MPSMRFLGVLILLLITANTSLSQDLLPELVRRIKNRRQSRLKRLMYAEGKTLARKWVTLSTVDRIVTNRHVLDGAYRAKYTLQRVRSIQSNQSLR